MPKVWKIQMVSLPSMTYSAFPVLPWIHCDIFMFNFQYINCYFYSSCRNNWGQIIQKWTSSESWKLTVVAWSLKAAENLTIPTAVCSTWISYAKRSRLSASCKRNLLKYGVYSSQYGFVWHACRTEQQHSLLWKERANVVRKTKHIPCIHKVITIVGLKLNTY